MMAITTSNSIKVKAPFCDLLHVIFFMFTGSLHLPVCLNFPRLGLGRQPVTPSRGIAKLFVSSTGSSSIRGILQQAEELSAAVGPTNGLGAISCSVGIPDATRQTGRILQDDSRTAKPGDVNIAA
jgi:hypothetical protein